MVNRIYMSEVSRFWTFERQKVVLAHINPDGGIFSDTVTRRERQGRSATRLPQRTSLVRPTTRLIMNETLYVASLAVLAWSEDDLREFMAALSARGTKLASVDDGEWDDVVAAWIAARTKARVTGGALSGGQATKQRMEAVYAAKAETIRTRWGDGKLKTADLLAEAGISRNTANKYLGLREVAVQREKARLARAKRKNQLMEAV